MADSSVVCLEHGPLKTDLNYLRRALTCCIPKKERDSLHKLACTCGNSALAPFFLRACEDDPEATAAAAAVALPPKIAAALARLLAAATAQASAATDSGTGENSTTDNDDDDDDDENVADSRLDSQDRQDRCRLAHSVWVPAVSHAIAGSLRKMFAAAQQLRKLTQVTVRQVHFDTPIDKHNLPFFFGRQSANIRTIARETGCQIIILGPHEQARPATAQALPTLDSSASVPKRRAAAKKESLQMATGARIINVDLSCGKGDAESGAGAQRAAERLMELASHTLSKTAHVESFRKRRTARAAAAKEAAVVAEARVEHDLVDFKELNEQQWGRSHLKSHRSSGGGRGESNAPFQCRACHRTIGSMSDSSCVSHPGFLARAKKTGAWSTWTCCSAPADSEGCSVAGSHTAPPGAAATARHDDGRGHFIQSSSIGGGSIRNGGGSHAADEDDESEASFLHPPSCKSRMLRRGVSVELDFAVSVR